MADAPGPGLHVNLMGPIPLPLARGKVPTVHWYASVRSTELTEVEHLASTLREQEDTSFSHLASSMAVNSVLVIGEPENSDNPLVRVHSSCLTGDVWDQNDVSVGHSWNPLWTVSRKTLQAAISSIWPAMRVAALACGLKRPLTYFRTPGKIPTKLIARWDYPMIRGISRTPQCS